MKKAVGEKLAALQALPQQRMSDLFANDERRFEDFSACLDDLLLDFSKTAISRTALSLLIDIAQAAEVEARCEAMFAGEKINRSEDRAVLHTALRAEYADSMTAAEIMEIVAAERKRMLAFAEGCRCGDIAAADGKPYTDVVNIGIGGSDLGPAMAAAALAPFADDGLRLHFVSNMDGAHLGDTLAKLSPARTLIIVSSKTFTTIETMTNAAAAREWLRHTSAAAAQRQLVAVTAATAAARAFGAGEVFGYNDWVGGRYSLWGAVGLPLALAIGASHFGAMLAGARDLDKHFRTAPINKNLPLLLALAGVWHRNVCGYPTRAILPYDQRLHLLPAYLQQLEMESNGKRVLLSNEMAAAATVPVVWGSVGTNAQHAYFQMLHQGTDIVPCEFIIAARPIAADAEQHKILLANCLAQSAALMRGDLSADGAHRHFVGERPSVTIFYRELSPYTLGRLIALYEHRVFCEGVIWGINSFDQWGVELGKAMAKTLRPLVDKNADRSGQDTSTQGLLAHYDKLAG